MDSASLPSSRLPKLTSSWLIVEDISRHSDRYQESRRDLFDHKEPGGRWGNPRMTCPNKPRTSKNYHGILRAFFNWCIAEGELARSPMERIAVSVDRADPVQPFTQDQLLLLDMGMRASELCELKMRDIDLQNGDVMVEGKGGKSRRLPFSRDTKRALYNYLNEADERETCGGVAGRD